MIDFLYDPPDRSPGKPLKWIVIDSLIIAAIAFISSLPQDRLPNVMDLYIALKAFAFAFFVQFALERGIKPFWYKRRRRYGYSK